MWAGKNDPREKSQILHSAFTGWMTLTSAQRGNKKKMSKFQGREW